MADCSTGCADRKWQKLLWDLNIPHKVKLFVWRAFHNILPTGQNLIHRGIGSVRGCRRCQEGLETGFHALVCCTVAWQMWSESVFWSKISRFKGDQDDLFLLFMSAALKREDLELFCMVLWLVCKD